MSDAGAAVDLRGKVALVTSAGREPGRSLALALAAAGANVALNDLTPMGLDETASGARQMGSDARAYVEDPSKGLPARDLMERVLVDFGRVDVLANFAVVRPRAALLEMDEWDWQRTFDFNLHGPLLMMKAAVRAMREQGEGVILNVTGARAGAAGEGAYNASTAGLLALSQTAAAEFLAYNIRVHVIGIEEERPDTAAPLVGGPTRIETFTRLALFLCSPQAAGLTGQVFRVDNHGVGKG